ncbi:MAG: hypothetical protein HQK76_18265 [Desulfobacterales bacterium]|nr:hypothetical protein [Desulfobacterales bacterium]
MRRLDENLIWIDDKNLPKTIKNKMVEFGITSLGFCKEHSVIVAKKNNECMCPEIIDDLCANISDCKHNANECESGLLILLNDKEIPQLLEKLNLKPSKEVNETTSKKEKDISPFPQKIDNFNVKAFAKLRFELTKKVATESQDIKVLRRALLEEFGIPVVPPELIAVFNMEIKKNNAKKEGLSLRDYLLKESLKKK